MKNCAFIFFTIIFLLTCHSNTLAANKELSSLCGFDFSQMNWGKFNDNKIIEDFGIGCGYEPNAPASRRHVFYDPNLNIWIQFNVIENDNWLVLLR